MSEEEYEIRLKSGIKWQLVGKSCLGTQVISGFTRDDLDTKEVEETVGKFGLFFVALRKVLEQNESCCLDNEEERLKICQEFATFATRDKEFLSTDKKINT